MTFTTIINFVNIGLVSRYVEDSPIQMIELLNHNINIYDNQTRVIDELLRYLNFDTQKEKLILCDKIMQLERSPIVFGYSNFTAGSVEDKFSEITELSFSPAYQSAFQVLVDSKDVKFSYGVFYVPELNIKCSGDLYFKNMYFGNSNITINGRKLSRAEVSHINYDNSSFCPIEKKITLQINPSKLSSKNEVQQLILPRTGDEIKLILQKTLISNAIKKDKLLLEISDLNNILTVCAREVDKVVQVDCSKIDDYDFMSI